MAIEYPLLKFVPWLGQPVSMALLLSKGLLAIHFVVYCGIELCVNIPCLHFTMFAAGQNMSIVVLSNTDTNWRVQHESGFSVYLMERISPGFHGELSRNLPQ